MIQITVDEDCKLRKDASFSHPFERMRKGCIQNRRALFQCMRNQLRVQRNALNCKGMHPFSIISWGMPQCFWPSLLAEITVISVGATYVHLVDAVIWRLFGIANWSTVISRSSHRISSKFALDFLLLCTLKPFLSAEQILCKCDACVFSRPFLLRACATWPEKCLLSIQCLSALHTNQYQRVSHCDCV